MASASPAVPDESMLLCEGCGYILNGLPPDSRCPECAKPIAESLPNLRLPPAWEQADAPHSRARRFITTTLAVLATPRTFYRTLATRSNPSISYPFARHHAAIASLLLALTGVLHLHWMSGLLISGSTPASLIAGHIIKLSAIGLGMAAYTYVFILFLIRMVATLTIWEAAYRGLRLPRNAVLRALHYHTAAYLPVAILALLTVAGYQVLLFLHVVTGLSATRYLYVLCAEVFLAAGYLFETYWIGMRNIMYANR